MHISRGLYFPPMPVNRHDPVAQLVEHLTFNQRVTGSNPVGVTQQIALVFIDRVVLFAQVAKLVDAPS